MVITFTYESGYNIAISFFNMWTNFKFHYILDVF